MQRLIAAEGTGSCYPTLEYRFPIAGRDADAHQETFSMDSNFSAAWVG
jgi:hypothetical protein